MSARLTVIFYIILCLEAGAVLTVFPWINPFGLGDWGDNYFLLYAAQKTGLQGLQYAISSGWVRGAVSGLGVLNLIMAFWEIIHFHQTVRAIETNGGKVTTNDSSAPKTNHLLDNERQDSTNDNAER
jgi:hypothetical protein